MATLPHSHHIMGQQVMTNRFLVKHIEVPVEKSWVTRFLDFALQWNPCNPWHSPDSEMIEVPSDEVMVLNDVLICHPALLPRLREALQIKRGGEAPRYG